MHNKRALGPLLSIMNRWVIKMAQIDKTPCTISTSSCLSLQNDENVPRMGWRDGSRIKSTYCSWKGLQAQFLAPLSGSSQLCGTPAPRDLVPFSGLYGHCTHVHIPPHRCTRAYNLKIKTSLEKERMSKGSLVGQILEFPRQEKVLAAIADVLSSNPGTRNLTLQVVLWPLHAVHGTPAPRTPHDKSMTGQILIFLEINLGRLYQFLLLWRIPGLVSKNWF